VALFPSSNELLCEAFANGEDSSELSKVLHRRNHDFAARQPLERETSPPNPEWFVHRLRMIRRFMND
jgi:hypothetical protein